MSDLKSVIIGRASYDPIVLTWKLEDFEKAFCAKYPKDHPNKRVAGQLMKDPKKIYDDIQAYKKANDIK